MRKVIALIIIGLMALVLACSPSPASQKVTLQREGQLLNQSANLERARAVFPDPVLSEFETRGQVVKWTDHINRANVWYTYIYLNGIPEPIGFFISASVPTPYCAFLAPPEQILRDNATFLDGSEVVVQAPGVDGVYWGQGDCYNYQYFWDASTDAMIQTKGFNLISLNAPLDLDVPEFKIRSVGSDAQE